MNRDLCTIPLIKATRELYNPWRTHIMYTNAVNLAEESRAQKKRPPPPRSHLTKDLGHTLDPKHDIFNTFK